MNMQNIQKNEGVGKSAGDLPAGSNTAYLQIAPKLHANGYSPIPVAGKRPVSERWEREFADERPTLDDVVGMHAQRGNGVGIATHGGLIIIDVDCDTVLPRVNEILRAAAGAVSCRGKRGLKFFFRSADGKNHRAWNRKLKDADGHQVLEILAWHAQGVAPPSMHPETGQPYEWVDDTRTLLNTRLEDLPTISADQVQALFDAFPSKHRSTRSKPTSSPKRGIPKAVEVAEWIDTIHDWMATNGTTRFDVPTRNNEPFVCDVFEKSAWKRLVRAALDCEGDRAPVLSALDNLSRLSRAPSALQRVVAEVYRPKRNAEIVDGVLSPEQYLEDVQEEPITFATLRAMARHAARLLGRSKSRKLHAASDRVAGYIRTGRYSARLVFSCTYLDVCKKTKPGPFRDFCLDVNERLLSQDGARYEITTGMKDKLRERYNLSANQLSKWLNKLKHHFAVVAGRHSADRSFFVGWQEPSVRALELAEAYGWSEITEQPDAQAECKSVRELSHFSDTFLRDQVAPVSTRHEPRVNLDPNPPPRYHPSSQGRGWHCLGAVDGTATGGTNCSVPWAASQSRSSAYFRGHGGLEALRVLAGDRSDECFCWNQLEKDVLPFAVEQALIAAYYGAPRAALSHARAAAADLRTIMRSQVAGHETQMAVIAAAHWRFDRYAEVGQAPSDDPRKVMKAWRDALAWAADRHGVWCAGAVRLERARDAFGRCSVTAHA